MKEKGFKLEQILKYRVEMERIRTQEFLVAQHTLDAATDLLTRERAALDACKLRYRDCQESFESIDDIAMHANFLRRRENEVERQRQQVEDLTALTTEKRSRLLEATKDKKVLESLKEKKVREFRISQNQREQLFLDEISVQKGKAA